MKLNKLSNLYKYIFCFGIILSTSYHATAQENKHKPSGKNLISLSLGYAYVKEGTSTGGTEAEGIIVPSIGLNYFRYFSEYAKFGIMVDYELDHYLVFNQDYERENALIIVAGASFEFQEHLILLGGFGREYDKHHQVPVVRVGAVFPFHFKKGWIIEPGVLIDFKEGYNVYTFDVGFGLHF